MLDGSYFYLYQDTLSYIHLRTVEYVNTSAELTFNSSE